MKTAYQFDAIHGIIFDRKNDHQGTGRADKIFWSDHSIQSIHSYNHLNKLFSVDGVGTEVIIGSTLSIGFLIFVVVILFLKWKKARRHVIYAKSLKVNEEFEVWTLWLELNP